MITELQINKFLQLTNTYRSNAVRAAVLSEVLNMLNRNGGANIALANEHRAAEAAERKSYQDLCQFLENLLV